MPVIPALGKWLKNEQKLKIILGCIVSLKTAWDTGNPAPTPPTITIIQQQQQNQQPKITAEDTG